MVLENCKHQMEVVMKVIFLKVRSRDLDCTSMEMEAIMKVNLWMVIMMVLGARNILMEIEWKESFRQDNLLKEILWNFLKKQKSKNMVISKFNSNGEAYMKDNLKMAKNMEKESILIVMEKLMKVSGKMIKNQGKGSCNWNQVRIQEIG